MDTTEKVYHEVKYHVNEDAALYTYMYKRGDTVVVDNMCVAFTTSDEKNIERMREKTKVDGFMFWADSEEGKKWKEENRQAIAAALLNGMRNMFNGGSQ